MTGAGSNGKIALERPAELLRFATAGSVDDGKSTLIGRLLYDTKQIFADQLEHVEQTSARRGDGYVNLALLTDGLRAEREQGITIDVAYRYFATPRRSFIIADTPGHVQYTRNMVTGASTADLAIVLVDARKGVLEQTRRHAFLASLLRVPHVVLAVNKMDLVDYDEAVYERIVDEFTGFASKLEVADLTAIPISALNGDNVVERSENMPWYDGTSLLYHLEHVHIASDRNLIDCRFPVQWVIRPTDEAHHDYRGYAGRVASGVFKVGDEVVVLPSGKTTRIKRIESYDGPVEEAFPPLSVTMLLEDEIDISRGDYICRLHNQPTPTREFEAMVCWLNDRPLNPRARYALKHTTRSVRAVVDDLRYRVDVNTLHRDEAATTLGLNEIGRLKLRTSAPLLVDEYRRNRTTGSFVLIDEATNETVAGGMVLETDDTMEAASAAPRSPDVTWHAAEITRDDRWSALETAGATLWFTGLPASGKSTVAVALERRLVQLGRPAYVLDGDNLRHGINGDLGFNEADRAENIRRTAHVARMLADAGVVVLVSLVSPLAAERDRARALHAAEGLPFFEIWVNTPLEVCEQRDPKGLYARARRGELPNLTGIGAPYEEPAGPDVVISDDRELDHWVAELETLLSRLSPSGPRFVEDRSSRAK